MKTTLVVAMMTLVIAPTLWAWGDGEGYADLVERVQAAVVNIQSTKVETGYSGSGNPFEFFNRRSPAPRQFQGAGTGFIISEDGYIVTNRHVVNDSDDLKVIMVEGKTYEATLVGTDDSLDVALIKIDAHGLNYLKLGDSDKMRIGDTVLAMGYPLQFGFSVTKGIISGFGRNLPGADLATYIQTDADITFGNSGGPLINNDAEVIAINTMIISQGETYGFSIPSNLFMNSIDQLRRHGKVERGALGVSLANLTEEAREYYNISHGVLVNGINRGLPAERAGIKEEDVILEVDGAQVKKVEDVVAAISSKPPGERVSLKLLSNGREQNKTLTLADRRRLFDNAEPEPARYEVSPSVSTGLGFKVTALNRQNHPQYGNGNQDDGLLVEEVDPESLAAERGIRPGSIITHIDRKPVATPKDMNRVLDSIPANRPVPVRVLEITRTRAVERTVFLRKR